ncbi:cache domain-containing sensor histidine kinase [Cohnella hongkongensis]|uniref:histidine kinase n=1 Tax=Cohnella hongkongensis TaxID=178337 RepID=A0ABV9FKT2_9BACL
MRIRGRIQRLGTQLILYYMMISLIVLSGASYFIYSFMLNVFKDSNERLLLQQFQQLDHHVDGLARDVDSLSKLFLADANVQRFIAYTPDLGVSEFLALKQAVLSTIESYARSYDFIDSIYIVGEASGAVGGDDHTTLAHWTQEWQREFLASSLFVGARRSFPEMVVQGGIRKTVYNPYLSDSAGETVISMARGVRPIYESSTSAVLIMNVDERYLSSIYSTSMDADDGKMYIVDEHGIVISSSQPHDIGARSAYELSAVTNGYGSLDFGQSDSSVQIVYYRLHQTDWHMIKEIPLGYYSAQIRSAQLLLGGVICSSLIVMLVISYFWLQRMVRPLRILAHKMKDMSRGELGITYAKIPNNEFGMVIRRFNEMSLSIVELIRNNNDIQEKRRLLEIETLRNQINPHFLYNTLNMIRWMAVSFKAEPIENSVVALGNILRPAFASKEASCTLRDELTYLDNYIKIINWRFNDHVKFTIHVDENDLDLMIPRFILQPLIENCVASDKQKEGSELNILVRVSEEDGDAIISVMDSGDGIDPERLKRLNERLRSGEEHADLKGDGHGIGLYNVNKRIKLNYGNEPYGVSLVSRGKGTEVRVRLPRQHG